MPYSGVSDKRSVIWSFFVKNCGRTIAIIEISTLKFFYLENFTKKQKCLNLGPKMPDLGIFGLEFENNFAIFEISQLKFV